MDVWDEVVDPDDDVPDDEVERPGTVLATVVVPVLDVVLPDVDDVDDVTPPVERSCPRIVRRDCSSAISDDGLLLETPDPVVEDVDEPVGLVVAMWVKPSEGPPVDDVDDPVEGAAGVAPGGGVVAMWVKPSEGPPVEDVDDPVEGAAGVAPGGGVVAMWVKPSEGPPVEDVDGPEGGVGTVTARGGAEEDPAVEPLVPVLAGATPGVPLIWSCDSMARKPGEVGLAAGSVGDVFDCPSAWSKRSAMDVAEPLLEAALPD